MGASRKYLYSLGISLALLACDKSPQPFYQSMTTKEIKRAVIVDESAQTEAVSESNKVVSQHSRIDGTVAAPEEVANLSEGSEQANASEAAPFQMCHALLKTLINEPYFYQFQANLKALRFKEEHGDLVRGHVVYHGIEKSNASDLERYRECADIVSSFDRYRDMQALWDQPYQNVHDLLRKRLMVFRSTKNFYPVERCADIISSLGDESEFLALITELSRSPHEDLSPEVMMGSLLEANESIQQKNASAMITPSGCIKAFKSFKSFGEIKQFAALDPVEQKNRLGIHSSAIVAH